MDRRETAHWDVAAYALGVLDPREIPHYEQHLAECPGCATELDRLLPASRLLTDVDPAELRQVEDFRLADRLLAAVREQRRRARGRRRLAVAAGTAVAASVAGFALFAGAAWFAPGPSGAPPPDPARPAGVVTPPGIGGPELGGGQRFSATDPTTGVHADVLLEEADWGTLVSFALSALTGPRECRLVVVHADGTLEATASWQVPAEGYGTPGHPEPLTLQAVTAAPRTGIRHIEVRELAADGTSTALVTVPV
jgi:hypothetical protein